MNNIQLDLTCKKVRRLEILITILIVLVIILISLHFNVSSSKPGIIQAKGFQLVSESGQPMGGLVYEDGVPSWYLADSEGNKRLIASHNKTGTQLFIKDEIGTTRIGIAQFSHGGGGIALHGENSKGAAVLYYKDKGSLTFYDVDGKVTNQLKSLANQ